MTIWKDHELRLAKAITGRRNGATGRATADVENNWLCVEAKCWKGSVKRVETALEQAERAAKPDQLPVAIIHTVGRHSKNDLLVLRWGDFQIWFGEPQTPTSEVIMELEDHAANGDVEARQMLAVMAPDRLRSSDKGGTV